ncbi:aminopeptidase N [Galactobacter valiniphilus]|uniref:Aminopeptidase N n=1 Tax=Galactobacter valiniphilus TaxID=2676122 RepID=A0A399JAM6_9MICC|nr:aminopeptidase N [Galactobacter valiniphilus]RII41259.1 aminopeptidase N [Galactobacter valiniphilus]
MPGLNLTRAEAQERAGLISTESYDVRLDLSAPGTTFRSVSTVTFSATAGSSSFIDAVTREVHSVVLNGVELDPAEVADGVRIALPNLAAENVLTVDATMDYSSTGEGLHRFVDPADDEVYLYTQFEVPDSRRMFAVFEQPDLKATFAFTVTAPAHWDVISNQPTPQPEAGAEGTATWTFSPTPVLSSYVTALVAGPYASTHSTVTSADGREVALGAYARKSLFEHLDAENIFEVTRQGFEVFEKDFGVAYPFEKYDQLFVPEFNAGAMENAGCVTILEDYVFRSKVPAALVERRAITVLHELAHMWFGDLVTMKWWNDLWLNESFAEFMSTHAAAVNTQYKDTAWTTFSSLEKSWAYDQDQLPSTHPIKADIRDLEDVQVNFDGITYAKGASVLRQLVAWVGQDEFMAGVREYFKKHAYSNTELSDLLVELEASSGRDLSEWSRQWLETAGVNTLRPELTVDADDVITSFAIVQTTPEQHPTLRAQRLRVGLHDVVDGKLVRREFVELDVDGARTEVPQLVGKRRGDLVLVNDGDLGYAKLRLDPRSLRTAIDYLSTASDSLVRALLWGAVWDATRDGEIAARDYVELVLNNIGPEQDSTTIKVQLAQLRTALARYVAPEFAEATAVDATDRLWALAQAAEAGSDSQFMLVMTFSSLASTEAQLATVAALRSGEITLEGLEIDTDLNWELLTSLVAGGVAGEDEIASALAADRSATGELAAALARAAVPTAEAKAAAWSSLIESQELSNTFQRKVIAGFQRTHDKSLLAPYVAPYFAAVEGVWTSRSYEMAQAIVNGLYPARPTSQDTLEATDAALAGLGERIPALSRLLSEARDGMARALNAQKADATR